MKDLKNFLDESDELTYHPTHGRGEETTAYYRGEAVATFNTHNVCMHVLSHPENFSFEHHGNPKAIIEHYKDRGFRNLFQTVGGDHGHTTRYIVHTDSGNIVSSYTGHLVGGWKNHKEGQWLRHPFELWGQLPEDYFKHLFSKKAGEIK